MSEPSSNGSPDLKRTRRQRAASSSSIDRLPPHNIECEMGVLGCCLLSPNDCIADSIIKFGEAKWEVFYDLRHQEIFKAMCEMVDKREQIDLITLQSKLKNEGMLDQVGGIGYLAGLPDTVPSSANLSHYADHVLEKHILRKLIHSCTDIIAEVYEFTGTAEELLERAEHGIMSARKLSQEESIPTMKECVNKAIDTIEEYHKRQGKIIGMPTGLPDLDKLTGGLTNGEVFVIAGRPSTGKTSLAMNIAEHVAVELELPVGVFSLEMTRDSLVMRMLCSRAKVNLRSIKDGFMVQRDFDKITLSGGKLAKSQIIIEDISGLSILNLKARARRMMSKYKIKLLVIDYLQLMHATIGTKRIDNRQQEIAEISGGVKALAKELGIPVILLSQLNREIDKREGKPRLSDLRESGAIEQDADIIGLLYDPNRKKEEDKNGDEADEFAKPINLFIAKQRNGPVADVYLTFLKPYTRFESAAKVSDDDVPNYDRD